MQIASRDAAGWSLKFKLIGLEPGCQGKQMDFVVTYRTTAHSCLGLPCTAVDQTEILASCTVDHRFSCKINVPVNPIPAIMAPGGSEIFGFSVINATDNNRAFEIGILTRDMF